MLADWLLPRAGMMLAFLVLSGVMWTAYERYELYAVDREAGVIAGELADQIAMVANTAPEYSSLGFARKILLPSLRGSPYKLIVDGDIFQIKVEDLERGAEGIGFLPVSAVYNENGRALHLEGFEITDSEGIRGYIIVGNGMALRIIKAGGDNYTLTINALREGDGFH